jgi:hypothetical protein
MSSTDQPQGPGRRADYEIGYGRPPISSQFKFGNRCNPRGRPKHKKTVGELIEEAMNEKVRIVVDGKPKTMTKQQVIIHRLVNTAARGDSKAIHTLFSLKARFQDSAATTINPADLDAADRSIIEDYFAKASTAPDPASPTAENNPDVGEHGSEHAAQTGKPGSVEP